MELWFACIQTQQAPAPNWNFAYKIELKEMNIITTKRSPSCSLGRGKKMNFSRWWNVSENSSFEVEIWVIRKLSEKKWRLTSRRFILLFNFNSSGHNSANNKKKTPFSAYLRWACSHFPLSCLSLALPLFFNNSESDCFIAACFRNIYNYYYYITITTVPIIGISRFGFRKDSSSLPNFRGKWSSNDDATLEFLVIPDYIISSKTVSQLFFNLALWKWWIN